MHAVTLSSYFLGETPVTQAEWNAVMGDRPSLFHGDDDCPVENVSWNDIKGFIKKLNGMTGQRYRLPTEAEWEFAARGGNLSHGYAYSGSNDIHEVAWYEENSAKRTSPVKRKKPNELGLYDMSGNVWECCSDWYGLYEDGAATNPKGPKRGSARVRRGGSWDDSPRYCAPSYRDFISPDYSYGDLGFRLAATVL